MILYSFFISSNLLNLGNLCLQVDFSYDHPLTSQALLKSYRKVQKGHKMLRHIWRCDSKRDGKVEWSTFEVLDEAHFPTPTIEIRNLSENDLDQNIRRVTSEAINWKWNVPPPPFDSFEIYEVMIMGINFDSSLSKKTILFVVNHSFSDLQSMTILARDFLFTFLPPSLDPFEGEEESNRTPRPYHECMNVMKKSGFFKTVVEGGKMMSQFGEGMSNMRYAPTSNRTLDWLRSESQKNEIKSNSEGSSSSKGTEITSLLSSRQTVFAKRVLPSSLIQKLKEKCAKMSITLHGPLVAAILYTQLLFASKRKLLHLDKFEQNDGPPSAFASLFTKKKDIYHPSYMIPIIPSVDYRRRIKFIDPNGIETFPMGRRSIQSGSGVSVFHLPVGFDLHSEKLHNPNEFYNVRENNFIDK